MASLPSNPKGAELEDMTAAILQCAGYYVDKQIIEREGRKDVLELDVVATDYRSGCPELCVAEVKSGGWGFSDLFKLLGWMHYLAFDRGLFVGLWNDGAEAIQAMRKRVSPFGVRVIACQNLESSTILEACSQAGMVVAQDDIRLPIWRFSFWMERLLIDRLRTQKKCEPTKVAPGRALEYLDVVNNEIFFEKDVRQRAYRLYDAFRTTPRLTRMAAADVKGVQYHDDVEDPALDPVINEALWHSRHPTLHACMYVEHRARLAILKAAVDYICLKRNGKLRAAEDPNQEDILTQMLPISFRKAISRQDDFPSLNLYPYFWQTFMWGWGGFYLVDRKEQEFEELSRETGVPVVDIPSALSFYEKLFDGTSWFSTVGPSQAMLMKMVPACFRGLGAVRRLRLYNVNEYKELGYADYTGSDLAGWHNAAVAVLEKRDS